MTATAPQPIKVQTTKVFRFLQDSKARIRMLRGGTRSSKTYNILLWFITDYLQHSGRVLTIARETMPALKATAMRDFFEVLDSFGVYDERNHNKTSNEYELNGNLIEFIPLSESKRIRGRKRTDAFINEINETTLDAFRQLSFRTSRYIVGDYNPSDPYSWVYDDVESRPDCDLLVTTYKDNPFLEPALIKEIEMLQESDEEYWTVYGLGEIGRGGSRIFPHWKEHPGPYWPYNKGQTVYGMDFGFNNPTALVEVTYYDNGLYWREMLYERGLTNADIVQRLRGIPELRGHTILCDSAEPDKIEDLRRAGFRAVPAYKAIKETVDFVKTKPMYIHPLSGNILREIKKYSWKTDKKTGLLLDDPVDFDNHAMDAGRYASYHFHRGPAKFYSA